jgi:polyisoprenyl-phosphate glycosyltransferase
MPASLKYSIIIPVFHGGDILTELTRRISDVMQNTDFEIIFIGDKCNQYSHHVLEGIRRVYPSRVRIYHLLKNYGQHKALLYGFGLASGDIIITMDEDLQHDPEEIPGLIRKQKEGEYDVVYGRFPGNMNNKSRSVISYLARKILRFYIPELNENYSSFRLLKKETGFKAQNIVSPYVFIDDYLSRITRQIGFVNLSYRERLSGQSSYTKYLIMKHSMLLILTYTGVSMWMLILGVLLCIGSILVFDKLLISSGLVLILTGLTGTLIVRINKWLNSKPVVVQL